MKVGKHFTPSCVFGSTCKTRSKGKSNPLTVKWVPFNCKIIYTFSLPSNQVLQTENQERERESLKLRQCHRRCLLIVVAWSLSSPLNTDQSLVISFLSPLKLVIKEKHRSEPCHLVLVSDEAHHQRQIQIETLTRFQSLSIYHSLSLNLSLFLPPPLYLTEFESLMVLFWFLFL